jgi:hypothetical protein
MKIFVKICAGFKLTMVKPEKESNKQTKDQYTSFPNFTYLTLFNKYQLSVCSFLIRIMGSKL